MTTFKQLVQILKGGPGSGNFGHAGIPGQRGGSASEGGEGKPKGRTKTALSNLDKMPRDSKGKIKAILQTDPDSEFILAVDSERKDLPRKIENVRIDSLIGMEEVLYPDKVKEYIKNPSKEGKGKSKRPTVIRFEGKNYLIDGNHRASAAKLLGTEMLSATVVTFTVNDV